MKIAKFLVGGVVGAAAALFLSPRSGAENRALVAGKVEEYVSSDSPAAVKFRAATDAVKPKADAAVSKVKDVAAQAAPVANEAMDKINEARDKIASQIMRGQDTLKVVDAEVEDVIPDPPAETMEYASSRFEDAAEDAEETVEEVAEKIADEIEE